MNNLISVIIPVYNTEAYLRPALNSIVNQTYSDLEIICIDDGSTDNSFQILEEYKKTDKRILIVKNEKNAGLINALNSGINMASGNYIARMDSDDISSVHRLKVQLKYLLKNNLDLVSCSSRVVNSKGRRVGVITNKGLYHKSISFASVFTQPFVHGSLLGKTECFKKNLYSNAAIHSEDYELWCRLIRLDHKFGRAPQSLYFLRKHANSISRQFEETQISSHLKTAFEQYNFYFGAFPPMCDPTILFNRFSKAHDWEIISWHFNFIMELQEKFIREQNIIDKNLISDIHKITNQQILDIYLQNIKYGASAFKITPLKFKLMKRFFGNNSVNYLINKAKQKIFLK